MGYLPSIMEPSFGSISEVRLKEKTIVLDLNQINIDHTGRIFLRTKVFNRPLLSMALVDSGNLSTTLISERFFQALNRPLLPTNIVLRSPNNKQDIVVLGSTPPFKIWIENLSRPVEIEPLVV